jgi:UPF0755 protein
MAQKKKSAAKSAAKALAIVLILLILLIAGTSTLIYSLNLAPIDMAEETLFPVGKGSSGAEIASGLESRGLVRSALFFKLALRISGNVSRMKSGTYRLRKGMSALAIMETIAQGKQATIRVTVPEGYTRSQIAALLESKSICSASDFLKTTQDATFLQASGIPFRNAEGYLFPNTYDFPLNAEASEVAAAMVRGLSDAIRQYIPEAPGADTHEFQEGIILASIIEREYRIDAEAPLMASVFQNRLKIGMALQSCATVVYVITEIQGKRHPDIVYDRDLKIPDPYNTYLQRGLPPGPISNPGLTALSAVFNPARTKYLYFRLVDPVKGSHHFSESLSEHNQAAGLYTKAVAGKR